MSIEAAVKVGHVHLKVADLNRALGFYCDVLGFELKQRMGRDAALAMFSRRLDLEDLLATPTE